MKIVQHTNWISADVQARIDTPPIPLINMELEEERASNIIKAKLRKPLALATSETCNIAIVTLENSQPEEFLALLNNFKIAIYRTGTASVAGQINWLRMMLRGEALIDFHKWSSHNNDMKNSHLKHITEGLLEYSPPINPLYNQERVMHHSICKPWILPF